MKPICVPCKRFYRPKRNGTAFVEGMPNGNGVKPGLSEAHNWEPYKLWMGDLWECKGCGSTIIVGVARQPLSEHFMPDFMQQVVAYHADIQINDC